MVNIRRYTIFAFLPLLMIVLLGGCSQEEVLSPSNGTLQLNIGHVSQETETRATPSQLGKPLVDRFNLKIQRIGSEYASYDGMFVDNVELSVGSYSVMAYYGENVALGKDCPYYEGVVTATIEENQSTSVTIPCRVSNALVSVVFGRDEEEKARFDKFYKEYGFMVKIGNHSLAVGNDEPGRSIYFPAGSSPVLIFYGTLREDDRAVSLELQSDDLPVRFEAAEHAIVTLTLPEPESALTVNISKVEIETVTIEETIPISWLPAPTVTAQHRYDGNGCLVGTDVDFSTAYPGMQWRAVVTDAAGKEVRSVEGSGGLSSSYGSSVSWPYLPSGDYKATYYVVQGETVKEVNSRSFSVEKPQLSVAVGGYTSYTKYSEGDIDGANACAPHTVYSPSVLLNVSESILSSGSYDYTFTYTYAGSTGQVSAGKNSYSVTAIENQAVSAEPYRLSANVTFDGVSVSGYKDFRITGLPVTYAPPAASNWTTTGSVSFSGSEAKLNGNNTAITNTGFAIPAQTKVAVDYNVKVRAAAFYTTNKFTITIGSNEVFSQSLQGGLFSESSKNYSGSKEHTTTSQTTTIKCASSKQYTSIYSLSLKYSK